MEISHSIRENIDVLDLDSSSWDHEWKQLWSFLSEGLNDQLPAIAIFNAEDSSEKKQETRAKPCRVFNFQ